MVSGNIDGNIHGSTAYHMELIVQNFQAIYPNAAWLNLAFHQVYWILSHEALNCDTELQVLAAAWRWLRANWLRRNGWGEVLLLCARVGLLKPWEAQRLTRLRSLLAYPRVRALFRFYPAVPAEAAELCASYSSQLAMSATPRKPHEVAMLLGGWAGPELGTVGTCQVYNPNSNVWSLITADSNAERRQRAFAGCQLVGSVVHLVGGFDGFDALNSVDCWNLEEDGSGWYRGPSLLQKRCYVACASIGQMLFAVGGHNRVDGWLDTVECLTCTPVAAGPTATVIVYGTNWRTLPRMLGGARGDAGAAGVAGCLFVVGGFNGVRHLGSSEVYQPATNQWTMIGGAGLNVPRSGLSLVLAPNGGLFAVGGRAWHGMLASVELLTIESVTSKQRREGSSWSPAWAATTDRGISGAWVLTGKLSRRTSHHATVATQNAILVMGGCPNSASSPPSTAPPVSLAERHPSTSAFNDEEIVSDSDDVSTSELPSQPKPPLAIDIAQLPVAVAGAAVCVVRDRKLVARLLLPADR